MRSLVLGVLTVLFAARASACYGQDFSQFIGNVPPDMANVKLGMSVSEVQKIFPAAKPVNSSMEVPFLLVVSFPQSELWESALLEFRKEGLQSINLLIGTLKLGNSLDKAQRALRQVIDKNGDNYIGAIVLNSSKQPVPTRLWAKQGFSLFAVGPALEVRNQERTVFAADQTLRVGVTTANRSTTDLIPIATPDDIRKMLFEILSSNPNR